MLIYKIKFYRHNKMPEHIHDDFTHLYEMCMNKNYQTRPTASQLLGSCII